jgi:TonB family protein
MVIATKSTPKPRSTPDEPEKKIHVDEAPSPTPSPLADNSPTAETNTDAINHSGKPSSASGNARGHGGGATIQSQFGWYGSMLHDRFYSEWAQPSSLGANAKASALVKLRIEKDGRISSFEIVKSSGNATVDESINAVAKRVTKVEPLPAGLGKGEHYDVKINFELNSD